ncbi:hypothetical protein BHM03_00058154 [Ensete ventricosum]|nr:hypothetical protein BHM03_00058154 [Ensete ventricosum]
MKVLHLRSSGAPSSAIRAWKEASFFVWDRCPSGESYLAQCLGGDIPTCETEDESWDPRTEARVVSESGLVQVSPRPPQLSVGTITIGGHSVVPQMEMSKPSRGTLG